MSEFVVKIDDPSISADVVEAMRAHGVQVKSVLENSYVIVEAEDSPDFAGAHTVPANELLGSPPIGEDTEGAELLLAAHNLRKDPNFIRAREARPKQDLMWDEVGPTDDLDDLDDAGSVTS